MSNYTFTLNMIPNAGTPVVVNLSQGDIGRVLTFKLVEGYDPNITIATDASAITIEGTKPSGLGFSEACTATSGNTITVSTTEAMTQESGMIPAEVRFVAGTKDLGTANIIFAIEESPHPADTTDGTQETMQNLEARLQTEIDDLDDRIEALEAGSEDSGLTAQEKNLILTLFSKAAYAEDDAETSYDALEALWRVVYRSITYNLTNCHSSSSVTSVENGKGYSTALSVMGGYSITTASVTMGGADVTASVYHNGSITIPRVTGDVVITVVATKAVNSITATYTQSGTVYDTASLDDLKSDLVVTANYSDSTSETVTDYTLSGTLTEGTSVVMVSYGGKTATFNVTVSKPDLSLYNWDFTQSLTDSKSGNVAVLNGSATRDSNGITLVGSTLDYVTFDTNIFGANRTYEIDLVSLSQVQPNNYARIFTLKNGNYNNCGFLYSGNATKGWSIYNGNGWNWITSLDTDLSKAIGKTIKIYIDSSYYWHVYIDGTLVLETSEIVNGTAGTNTANNAITLGSSSSNSNDYNMVISGFRVYEGAV